MSLWEVLTSFFAFIGQTMVTWWPFSARARPGSIAAILTLLALRRKHKDYWIGSAWSNLIGSQNKKWPQFAPWTRRRRGMKRNIQKSETNYKTDTGPVFPFSLLHWYGCWSDDLCTQHLVRRVLRSELKACLAYGERCKLVHSHLLEHYILQQPPIFPGQWTHILVRVVDKRRICTQCIWLYTMTLLGDTRMLYRETICSKFWEGN